MFFLKLLIYLIVGAQWVRIIDVNGGERSELALPVGLIIGLILARHEHFAIDRKIEYAVLLIATVLSYAAPVGFVF